MKMYFILLMLPFISYCQTDTEFIFQKTFPIEDRICISKNDCLSFVVEVQNFNLTMIMSYSYGEYREKYIIDSVQIGDNETLSCYKLQTKDSYVIIWKSKFEHFPIFNIYYISDEKITKIGNWGIYVPCETCDTQDFYVEDFKIYQRNDNIEFSFLKDIYFIDYSEDMYNEDSATYRAGDLILSFNIVDRLLKIVKIY